MDVRLEVNALPGYPAPEGAHGLAWSYLLDLIFADAAHAGVGALHLSVPTPALKGEVQLRASLSAGVSAGDGLALAALTPDLTPDLTGMRCLYTLRYGLLAPPALRRRAPPDPTGWRAQRRLRVLTLKARALGLPMRLLTALKQPHFADRTMFAMREGFASEAKTPAFYELTLWERA